MNPVDVVPNSPESLLIRIGLSYAFLLKDEYAEQLVDALRDTEINVDSPEAEVKVYAE
ncbi:MAG: hypothetical protein NTX46_04270 [Chloroflexi bacterium]|nr:hypothetical protein [Chloroflexota bacterium]